MEDSNLRTVIFSVKEYMAIDMLRVRGMLDPSKALATNLFTKYMWNVPTQAKRNNVIKKNN